MQLLVEIWLVNQKSYFSKEEKGKKNNQALLNELFFNWFDELMRYAQRDFVEIQGVAKPTKGGPLIKGKPPYSWKKKL